MGVLGKDLFDFHRPQTNTKVEFGASAYWVEDRTMPQPYGAVLTEILNLDVAPFQELLLSLIHIYSLLTEAHLSDPACNALCRLFSEPGGPQNGVIVHSDLLLDYLRTAYPRFYFVSSTTKVLTGFPQLRKELEREAFRFVVPDFRLNRAFEQLRTLPQSLKDKDVYKRQAFCCQH